MNRTNNTFRRDSIVKVVNIELIDLVHRINRLNQHFVCVFVHDYYVDIRDRTGVMLGYEGGTYVWRSYDKHYIPCGVTVAIIEYHVSPKKRFK